MKFLLCSLTLALTLLTSQAGSFGGPPAFTNGSPLASGVDGSYQATARADNLLGIIRFSYSGGNQTTTVAKNTYVFFINGLVFSGETIANISGSNLSGVLGRASVPAFVNTSMTGEFNGKFDTKSSDYFFRGSGFLQTFLEVTPGIFNNLSAHNFKLTGIRNSQTP